MSAVSKIMVLPQEVDQVMFAVCSVYDVTRVQIMGRRRTEMLAEARQVAMVLVRRKGYTQEETAAAFGRKDHVTIGWAEKRCREKYSWDKKFMARWDNVKSIIDSTPVSLWRKVRITLDAELPEHEDLGDVDALSKATRLAVAGSSRVRNLEVTAA